MSENEHVPDADHEASGFAPSEPEGAPSAGPAREDPVPAAADEPEQRPEPLSEPEVVSASEPPRPASDPPATGLPSPPTESPEADLVSTESPEADSASLAPSDGDASTADEAAKAAETPTSDGDDSPSPASSGPPPPPPGRGRSAPPATGAAADDHSEAGRIVAGIITEVSTDEVELVLEDGRLAVVHRRNWATEAVKDLTTEATLGDRLEGAVLARVDPKSRVVLSRSWAREMAAWNRLEQAKKDSETLSLLVTERSAKGLVVDAFGVRGFVPASHVDLEPVRDLGPFVGQTLEFRVLELDSSPRRRRLVLSRRSLLMKEQRRQTHERLSALEKGSLVRGTVSSLSDYGAFVDLGGVQGLVHVSELAWKKVRHPSDVVAVGDDIEVKVLEVRIKKRRVRLSLREAGSDPFAGIEVGTVTTGIVTRLVDFGAFVELDGAEGLVHLSELAEHRVSAPEELVTPGDQVLVKVLSVDGRRRRIELSIRQAISDQFG